MNEERVRQLIKEELEAFIKSDKYVFHKPLQLLDRVHIHTGKTNGSTLGADTTQLAGFHGTASSQRANGNQTAVSLTTSLAGASTINLTDTQNNFLAIETLINEIRTTLVNKGIFKGSA